MEGLGAAYFDAAVTAVWLAERLYTTRCMAALAMLIVYFAEAFRPYRCDCPQDLGFIVAIAPHNNQTTLLIKSTGPAATTKPAETPVQSILKDNSTLLSLPDDLPSLVRLLDSRGMRAEWSFWA